MNWNDKVKILLKSKLINRGVSNQNLAIKLNHIGINETKASIDSKISRGRFSTCFILQCLSVIGCDKLEFIKTELNATINNSINNTSI